MRDRTCSALDARPRSHVGTELGRCGKERSPDSGWRARPGQGFLFGSLRLF